ncbi:retrotransposon ORF1 [Tanacetum coccineum]
MAYQDARLSKFEADFKQQQSEMTNKIDSVLKAIIDRITGALLSDTVKNLKLNVNSTSSVLSARSFPTEDPQCSTRIYSSINVVIICPKQPDESQNNKPEEEDPPTQFILRITRLGSQSSDTEFVCTKRDYSDVMFIEIIKKNDDSREEEPEVDENSEARELKVEHFNIFLIRSELAYHKYLMSCPTPSIFLRNPIITEGCPSNLKIPCNIGHVHVQKAYIDLNSPLNVMTRTLYNWIMRRKLNPRGDPNGRVSNFTGRIKGIHVFVENFTYVIDFMIVEDISSIIDPRLSQVVLGKPFVEICNMTHDPPKGVMRFTNRTDEIAYKMPYKIEQYNSLSDLEKEHTKSVYFRNEEDKRRGVDYVMSKILGFYKECLELGPEYLTKIFD